MSVIKKNVVIIGAGIAGLSAAEHLVKNGCTDLVVLEAQNRVGGRMYTYNFGKRSSDIIELGANWIHGAALNNPMITLACEHNLLEDWVFLDRMEGLCYTSDGTAINHDITVKLWKLFQQWEAETVAYDPSAANKSRPNAEVFMRQRFQDSLKKFPEEDHDKVKCVFNCLMNYEAFHKGTPMSGHPVPDIAACKDFIPGGNVKVKDGMSSLVNCVANKLQTRQIKLQREVIEMNYEKPEVVVVKCSNGEVYQADHVIVTVSLGVLKSCHRELFVPPLPVKKQIAIENIAFGKVNKIFLQWEKPFWEQGRGGIKFAWSDEERVVKNKSEWYKKIFSFDEVLNNRNVLIGWISGDEAEHLEGLPENEVLEVCTELIRRFLGNPSIPKPVRVIYSKWCGNPHIRGSWSNYCYQTTPQDYKHFSAPLCDKNQKPRVIFAGEAAYTPNHSTMHGARRSGLLQAHSLLKRKNVSSKL